MFSIRVRYYPCGTTFLKRFYSKVKYLFIIMDIDPRKKSSRLKHQISSK